MRRDLGDGYRPDDDPARVDVDAVHRLLSEESYWARGRDRDAVARSLDGSARVVGLSHDDHQIGFARVVSDNVSIAWLADVYVLPGHRGRGFGVKLVRDGRRQRASRRPIFPPCRPMRCGSRAAQVRRR